MQNGEKVYVQTLYRTIQKSCAAKAIVYCEARDKLIEFHYLDEKRQLQMLMFTGSLLYLRLDHPDAFTQIHRHFIVRTELMEFLVPSAITINRQLSVSHLNYPLPVSRRRLPMVKAALASLDSHAKNQVHSSA